jgi:arylsulfatase A-like enzyme
MDTHNPYNCTPVPEFIKPAPGPDSAQILAHLTSRILSADGRAVPQPLLQVLGNQYDAAVHNLDREIGKLLAYLEREGLFEDTVILITSDHGEYFGEHQLIEHNKDLYEPALAIPFLLKDAGQREGRVVTEPVSLVHVPWLLAQRTDALSEDDFPYSWPDAVLLAENHYTRLNTLAGPAGHRFQRSRLALYDGEHKYIHSTDGAFELFDLARDPGEQRNLIHEQPGVGKRLANRLRDALSARIHDLDTFDEGQLSPEEMDLSPELMEQLRSLGYL